MVLLCNFKVNQSDIKIKKKFKDIEVSVEYKNPSELRFEN